MGTLWRMGGEHRYFFLVPPPIGCLKNNFDVAFSSSSDTTSIGLIIQGDRGAFFVYLGGSRPSYLTLLLLRKVWQLEWVLLKPSLMGQMMLSWREIVRKLFSRTIWISVIGLSIVLFMIVKSLLLGLGASLTHGLKEMRTNRLIYLQARHPLLFLRKNGTDTLPNGCLILFCLLHVTIWGLPQIDFSFY